jgi:hypothetical protein
MKHTTASQSSKVAEAIDKSSCPACAALKSFQLTLIEGGDVGVGFQLCNFHAWALAKTAPAEFAAGVYLRALERASHDQPSAGTPTCGVCARIHKEENARLDELAEQFQRASVVERMQHHSNLCLSHARKLCQRLPAGLRSTLAQIVARNTAELKQELTSFLQAVSRGNHGGGGVLGRAAEFLVSQRGLRD